ncbi:MAG: PD40 domain-containing protein, partial [Deltaproteobacteria bacterium]|nr:PD40 domain-containing protein [Deltaproteobacteria bacterium]
MIAAVVAAGGLWWTNSGEVSVRSEPALEDAHPAEPPPHVRSRVLVRGEADVREPSLSPDGSQVVFVRRVEGGAELVLREVDGSGERVLSEEPGIRHAQPAFSPDGTRVAFSRSRGLYVIALDGGEARRITDSGVHPDWSPDGTRLAFTTEQIHEPEAKTTRSSLWVVDVESRRTHKVFDGDA